jgi:hypothetical protein
MVMWSSKAYIWFSACLVVVLVAAQLLELLQVSNTQMPRHDGEDNPALRILSSHSVHNTPPPLENQSSGPMFVLFIGPPKTGSTTLQHALHRYSDKLKEDN